MTLTTPLAQRKFVPLPPSLERRRITVREYQQMIAVGVFHEDDRLELIEGELLSMSPINPRHSGKLNRFSRLLSQRVGERAVVAIQNPISLGEFSEPQPDLVLLTPRADFYERSHPKALEVLLVVEIADSSLEFDRQTKSALYARAGIREYWLVNLVDDLLEVFQEPSPGGYKLMRKVFPGESVAPLAFADAVLDTGDIFG